MSEAEILNLCANLNTEYPEISQSFCKLKKKKSQLSDFLLAKLPGISIFRNISCSPGVFYASGSDDRCWEQCIKLKAIKYYKINSTGQIRLNGLAIHAI
jgi:hypothetical protein